MRSDYEEWKNRPGFERAQAVLPFFCLTTQKPVNIFRTNFRLTLFPKEVGKAIMGHTTIVITVLYRKEGFLCYKDY
jgi:hypothetical protein